MWWRKRLAACIFTAALIGAANNTSAHVPYLEREDYSPEQPQYLGDVEQSKALYSWLESDEDVDYFWFAISGPTGFFAEVIVPVCLEYETFLPSYALIGHGLPEPSETLPISLPPGYGAIVVPNLKPGEPRDTFFEPFGGKSYFEGIVHEEIIDTMGLWAIIVWDPRGEWGDYVLSVGLEERFEPRDIVRALLITPLIRKDRELHVECSKTLAQ